MEEGRILSVPLLELGHWCSLALGLGFTPSALLALRPVDADSNPHRWLSCVSSFPMADCGISHLPQACDPIPANKSMYVNINIPLVLPGEP